jgi:hypothetical protein
VEIANHGRRCRRGALDHWLRSIFAASRAK